MQKIQKAKQALNEKRAAVATLFQLSIRYAYLY
jgi:hypothetical protein